MRNIFFSFSFSSLFKSLYPRVANLRATEKRKWVRVRERGPRPIHGPRLPLFSLTSFRRGQGQDCRETGGTGGREWIGFEIFFERLHVGVLWEKWGRYLGRPPDCPCSWGPRPRITVLNILHARICHSSELNYAFVLIWNSNKRRLSFRGFPRWTPMLV